MKWPTEYHKQKLLDSPFPNEIMTVMKRLCVDEKKTPNNQINRKLKPQTRKLEHFDKLIPVCINDVLSIGEIDFCGWNHFCGYFTLCRYIYIYIYRFSNPNKTNHEVRKEIKRKWMCVIFDTRHRQWKSTLSKWRVMFIIYLKMSSKGRNSPYKM